MQLDLTPVLQPVLGLCGIAVTTFGSLALAELAARLKVQRNTAAMANFDTGLQSAIAFGLTQIQALICRRGWDHPEVRSAALTLALPALVTKFPQTLKAVGLDPASDGVAIRAKLQDALERAFPAAVAALATSPATPPADLTMATAPGGQTEPATTTDLQPVLDRLDALDGKLSAALPPVPPAATPPVAVAPA